MSLSPLLLSLLLVVAGDAVKSGDVPPPPPPPPPPESPYENAGDLRGAICQRPSLTPLVYLLRSIPPRENPDIEVILMLEYNPDGTVTRVSTRKESDVPELNAALVEWAKQVRMCPSTSGGQGLVPFILSLD